MAGLMDYLNSANSNLNTFWQNDPRRHAASGAAQGFLRNPYDIRQGLAAAGQGFTQGGVLGDTQRRQAEADARQKQADELAAQQRQRAEKSLETTSNFVKTTIPGMENLPPEGHSAALDQWTKNQLTQPKESAYDQEVSRLTRQGVAPALAHKIAGDVLKTSRDPITGAADIIDLTQFGQNTPLPAAPPPAASPATGGGLYNLTDKAAGVVNNIQDAASGVLGQIPGGEQFIDKETVAAKQDFRIAGNEMVRAMSNNPRFPIAEQERVLKMMADVGSFSSGPTAKIQLKQLDKNLRRRLIQERQIAQSPDMPADQRQKALGTATAIENFLTTLGVPQGGENELSGNDPLGIR